jgi:hypothetical protein
MEIKSVYYVQENMPRTTHNGTLFDNMQNEEHFSNKIRPIKKGKQIDMIRLNH